MVTACQHQAGLQTAARAPVSAAVRCISAYAALPACLKRAFDARQAHEARQFTDVGSFTLRCGVCQVGVRGQKEAVEHAKATGHSNFSEYH